MKWSADSKAKQARKSSNFFLSAGSMKAYMHMAGVDLFDTLPAAHHPHIWGKRWNWPLFVNHLNAKVVEHGVHIAIWRRTLIEHRVPATHDPVSAQVSRWSHSCKHNMPCMAPRLCSISQKWSFQGDRQSAKGDVRCPRKIPTLLVRKSAVTFCRGGRGTFCSEAYYKRQPWNLSECLTNTSNILRTNFLRMLVLIVLPSIPQSLRLVPLFCFVVFFISCLLFVSLSFCYCLMRLF